MTCRKSVTSLAASAAASWLFRDPEGTRTPHPLETLDRRVEHLTNRGRERLHRTRGDEPTGHSGLDKLRDRRHVSTDHGTTECQRFHDHHRQPFGEARQDQGTTALDQLADIGITLPTRQSDVVAQIMLRDESFDLAPERPVAYEDQLEFHAIGVQPSRRRDQDRQALLLGQPPHADQAPGLRQRYRFGLQEHRIQPASDDFDLGPFLVGRPSGKAGFVRSH